MWKKLNYNDFYYTNMAVAKDGSSALMFDYNLLGRGYAFADLRNVAGPLGEGGRRAFLKAYGPADEMEERLDGVCSVLVILWNALARPTFPRWAQDSLRAVTDGRLLKALWKLDDISP